MTADVPRLDHGCTATGLLREENTMEVFCSHAETTQTDRSGRQANTQASHSSAETRGEFYSKMLFPQVPKVSKVKASIYCPLLGLYLAMGNDTF